MVTLKSQYLGYQAPLSPREPHRFWMAGFKNHGLADWFAVKKWLLHTIGSEGYELTSTAEIEIKSDADAALFRMVWMNDDPPFDGSW